jgi:hypothetical protein
MKYGDFSSLVQLGVGLHLGTALLQLYGEIGIQPLVRTLGRNNSLFAEQSEAFSSSIKEELSGVESDFELFKIRFFNEYKKYIIVNSVVAVVLTVFLVVIAYWSDDVPPYWATYLAVGLSIFPAPVTLRILWVEATEAIRPIKEKADKLEARALKHK